MGDLGSSDTGRNKAWVFAILGYVSDFEDFNGIDFWKRFQRTLFQEGNQLPLNPAGRFLD